MDFEKIYRDQGGRYTNIPGFQCASFYTPHGIKLIDARFCRRICAYGKGESYTEYRWSYWSPYSDEPKQEPKQVVEWVWTDTYQSIAKDIRENPHLHPEIKKNLMHNLRIKRKQLKNEN